MKCLVGNRSWYSWETCIPAGRTFYFSYYCAIILHYIAEKTRIYTGEEAVEVGKVNRCKIYFGRRANRTG